MAEATLAAERDETPDQEPQGQRRRRPLLIVAVALVVVIVAVLTGRALLAEKQTATVPVAGAVVTLPKTTLNLAGGSLLQVGVAVQLQAGVGTKRGLAAGELARLENREIVVLSQFSQPTLSTPTGKETSRAALLASFRQVVGAGRVGPGVMAVYYVDFIMQ